MIGDALSKLVEGLDLDRDQAAELMRGMMSGAATQSQIGAFLAAMRVKGFSVDELVGFVEAMRGSCTRLVAPAGAIDMCGTGGDRSGSFNISTASSFVVAACGVPVAKHGNRSVSSRSGSADVLEALHIPIDLGPEEVGRCIADTGIGFLFAPSYHCSMGNVASARREVGFRSVFNVLGPLTNPAAVKRQVIGVYDISIAPMLAACMRLLGSEHVMFVNGMGMDEITIAGETEVVELKEGKTSYRTIRPEDMGLETADPSSLRGDGPEENARTMLSVLRGERSTRTDVVLANAAAGLYVSGTVHSLAEGVDVAREAVSSGDALSKLKEHSRRAMELEGLKQSSMVVEGLAGRRVHPRTLKERAADLTDNMLVRLKGEGKGHLIGNVDPALLAAPNVLSVLVLGRLLSDGDDVARRAPRGGRLSDAIGSEEGVSLIAEYKPSSPSVSPPFVSPPLSLVESYNDSAAGVSVLAESRHFNGGALLFSEARAMVGIPMLYKDFLVTEGQLRNAAACGANAALLIAKALRTEQLAAMAGSCISLGMEPLVEVHDAEDMVKLEESGALTEVEMIGVNCRDLRTLATRPELFAEMRPLLPRDVVAIAESGLVTDELRCVKGYDAALVGSRFMESDDPGGELRRTVSMLRGVRG